MAESDSYEIRIMRMQSWQRAKGELEALCASFWKDDYRGMRKATDEFIELVEGWELFDGGKVSE